MAKHWIKQAVSKHPGKFAAKAKAAGMSTAAYAEKKKGVGGTLGHEAVLAQTLAHLRNSRHSK